MNPSDYRRDFAAYHTALTRERFHHHAGLSPRLDTEAIEERYSDLWTREAIADLSRVLGETPAQFETERRGLSALLAAARLKHAETRVADVTEELRRCEGAPRIAWDGAQVAAADVSELLAAETEAARRRELSRRWLDALSACQDLRSARLEALGAEAVALGFENRRGLYESYTGADLLKLDAAARLFLGRTERAYMTGLSRWAAQALAPFAPRSLEFADEFYFARGSHLDAHFPEGGFAAAYAETLAGLGVRVASQRNIQLDAAARAGKAAWPACFAVAPPEDVRLILGARARGAATVRRAFSEAGRAQMFAWASREMAARHPEFVRAPDAATEVGHGLLLAGLFRDPAWLGDYRGRRASEAREIAEAFALIELHEARRECAALGYALGLDASADARPEQLSESYVSQFTEATGFKYDAASRLLHAEDLFQAATRLRARLFAAAFAEHLRARHGRRWFASRGAGDELIDVWNTASRYAPEELARLAWGGEPDFELLGRDLSAGAQG